MRTRALLICLLSACSKTSPEGIVCGKDDACPSDYTCVADHCYRNGTIPDLSGNVSDAFTDASNVGLDLAPDLACVMCPQAGVLPLAQTSLATGVAQPNGIALDGAGNIYVADTSNNAIKKVVIATGAVSIVASQGVASPQGVAVDTSGNLYFTSSTSGALYQVTLPSGMPSEISAGFSHPQGIVADNHGNVYLADTGNNAVQRVTLQMGISVPFGTGFSAPTGLALNSANTILYIADTGNNAVKALAFTTSNMPTVVASSFSAPGNLALDTRGNLFVTETGTSSLKKIVIATGVVTTLDSTLTSPRGVAIDAFDNFYVNEAAAVDELTYALACATLSSDINNCGSCGNACIAFNATPMCVNGACTQ